MRRPFLREGELILKEDSFTVLVSVCRPLSQRRIALRNADPDAPPAILNRLFGNPDNPIRLARGVRAARRIVGTAPLANLVKRPIDPDWDDGVSDDELASYLLTRASTIYHPLELAGWV